MKSVVIAALAIMSATAQPLLAQADAPLPVMQPPEASPAMVLPANTAVMLRMNAFSRIALCGMIAGYDGAPLPMANPALMLINRMKVEGFIVSEHMEVWPDALKELGTLVGTGKLRPRETIAQGIAAAPEAFLGLLKGKNFGKQLVKLI